MLQVSFPLGSRSLTVYGLTQYDYGQELEVRGLPLPAVVECQISLQRVGGTTESLAGVVVDDTLTLAIPDTYLAADTDSDYTIYVYIYVTTEASGTTVYLVSLPVTARSMPEGYVPGETSPFAAVIDEMRELVEDAQDAATLSESYAKGGTGTRTGEDTDNSKYYSEEARDAETGAADSAAEARASEVAAAGSASTAAAASTSAAEAKTAAEAARDATTAKATEASNSASAAGVSAAAASASETAAGAYASTAGASAVSAASSASAAESSATSAASSASSAESSATAAADAKQDALTAISGAQTTAVGAVAAEGTTQVAAVTAEGTAQKAAVQAKGAEVIASIPEDYTELSNDVSSLKSDKADKTGTYSSLTAGNLATEDGSNNNTPYLFRASGGGVRVGEREYEKIVGGTVAWNQLTKSDALSKTLSGVVFTNNGDGSWNISGTATASFTANLDSAYFTLRANHKYLIMGCPSGGGANTYSLGIGGLKIDLGAGRIWDNSAPYAVGSTSFQISSGVSVNFTNLKPQVFDLTQMFGVTVADYLYTAQNTYGTGISLLKEWGFFTQPYYPYNAGELKSVEGLSSHEMVGKNLFHFEFTQKTLNGVTFTPTGDGGVHVRGTATTGTTYYIAGSPVGPSIYDLIPNVQYTIYGANIQVNGVSKGAMINKNTFTGDYINFVWLYVGNGETVDAVYYPQLEFGSEATDYAPYVKHAYPLDSTLTLRGIPKLDSANQLYYDGDTYESDGTVTRRYGIVDMGTLTWSKSGGLFKAPITNSHLQDTSVVGLLNVRCSKYPLASDARDMYNGTVDKVYIVNAGYLGATGTVWVRDTDYSDAASLTAALSGEYLVYELATSTSEIAEPFAAPQIVDEYGTEEYVTTGIVPVGHETFYPENLRQKIEGLPWNFASLIAPTEVAYKATQNYTSGSLFIVNNVLYKATANIANGGDIAPGTNCTATTLAAVIAAL